MTQSQSSAVSTLSSEATDSNLSSAETSQYVYETLEFEDGGAGIAPVQLGSEPLAAARGEAREQIDDLTADLLNRFKRFSRAKFHDVQALGRMLFNGAATTEHEPILMEKSQTRLRGPTGLGAWTQILPPEFNRRGNPNVLTSCHKRTYTACEDIRRIFRTALVAHCRLYALSDAEVSSQSQQTDTLHPFYSPSAPDVGVDVKLQRFITTSDTSRQPAVHFCLHWMVKWHKSESEHLDLLAGVSRIICRRLGSGEIKAMAKTRKPRKPRKREEKRRRAPADPSARQLLTPLPTTREKAPTTQALAQLLRRLLLQTPPQAV
jgi:hypothetical protein